MLDGLFKSKFYSRCKSDIQKTRTRVELIQKRINAMQKYLRNDIAELLRNGSDTDAYGRAEELLNDLNKSSCFEFLDQCCVTIANNLATMDKQRECPQECREAVASLMFAAARLAKLPELTKLRNLFSVRYSLDFYVDKQFMEKLETSHPSKEMKLQLLQDIAAESGLEWSSKALENQLFHETAGKKDTADDFNDKLYVSCDRTEGSVLKSVSRNRSDYVHWNPVKCTGPERKDGLSGYEQKYITEHVPIEDIQVDTIVRNETYKQPESRVPTEEKHDKKPLKSIPPPYIKSDVKKTTSEEKAEPKATDDEEYPTVKDKPAPKSARSRPLKPPSAHENSIHSENEEKQKETDRASSCTGEKNLDILRQWPRQYNERDEEEKMMDIRKKTPRGTVKSDSNIKLPPNRVSSLPGDVTIPTSVTHKGHARAFSLQPDMLNGNGHVHPKLPDYDEVVAKLAALRGKT